MSTYTSSRVNANYERVASCAGCQLRPLGPLTWDIHIRHPLLCAACLTTGPCTVKTYWHQPKCPAHSTQQWADQGGNVHCWTAYTWHWCIDIIFVWKRWWEHVSLHCQQSKCQLCASFVMCWMSAAALGPLTDLWDTYSPPTAVYSVPNHSTMTHPSKTD